MFSLSLDLCRDLSQETTLNMDKLVQRVMISSLQMPQQTDTPNASINRYFCKISLAKMLYEKVESKKMGKARKTGGSVLSFSENSLERSARPSSSWQSGPGKSNFLFTISAAPRGHAGGPAINVSGFLVREKAPHLPDSGRGSRTHQGAYRSGGESGALCRPLMSGEQSQATPRGHLGESRKFSRPWFSLMALEMLCSSHTCSLSWDKPSCHSLESKEIFMALRYLERISSKSRHNVRTDLKFQEKNRGLSKPQRHRSTCFDHPPLFNLLDRGLQ